MKRRFVALVLCIAFLLEMVGSHLERDFVRNVSAASETSMTMTDYYNGGNYKAEQGRAHTITISSMKEMLLFRECIADNQTEGVTFSQTTDITFGEEYLLEDISVDFDEADSSWQESGSVFQGTYEGNGYTIRGFKMENGQGMSGFFGGIGTKASVSNLIFEDVTFANGSGGIVAGVNAGVIQGCMIRNATCTNSAEKQNCLGGVAGINQGTVQNVTVEKLEIASDTDLHKDIIGGIAGKNQKHILNCAVQDSTISGGNGDIVGGIAGYAYSSTNVVIFKECVSRAVIRCGENGIAGGIAGYVGDSQSRAIESQREIRVSLCYYGGELGQVKALLQKPLVESLER